MYAVYLITNRHVFEGLPEAWVRVNPTGTDPAREFQLPLNDPSGKPTWRAHADPEIDVAIITVNVSLLEQEGIQFAYFRSDQHVMDRQACSDAGLSEGDGAFILGFPMGIVGGDRNYVIARQGAVARARDWLNGGAKEFLLDVSVFPGNSGGPAVTRPEALSIQGTQSPRSANLIGIVKGYVPYQTLL